MALAFQWRRREYIGITLLLLGLAVLIELLPLITAQYFLFIGSELILLLPIIGGTIVLFMIFLETIEKLSRQQRTTFATLGRTIAFGVLLVTIIHYLTFFISLGVLLSVSVNWQLLDSPTWSYILSYPISMLLSSFLVLTFLKQRSSKLR